MEEMNWAKSTRNSGAYSSGRWVGNCKYYTSGFTGCVLQEDAFELNERGDQVGLWWRSQMQMQTEAYHRVMRQQTLLFRDQKQSQSSNVPRSVTKYKQSYRLIRRVASSTSIKYACCPDVCKRTSIKESDGVQNIPHRISTIWQKR